MNFIQFLLDNIFIVAIVVIGLFNLLGGQGKKRAKEEERKRATQNRPASKTLGRLEGLPQRFEDMGQKIEEKLDEYTGQFDENTAKNARKTIAEQQQEQYDRLKENIQTSSRQIENKAREMKTREANLKQAQPVSDVSDLPDIKTHHQPTEVGDLNLHERLSARGLIDSVIMAEVLGPPRARKSYQNIAQQRKRR